METENKNFGNKIINGYSKFRKLTTGNSLEDLKNKNSFSFIESIKEKFYYYILGLIVGLIINWKLTIALVLTICFAIFLENFVKIAKKAAIDAEKEINNK